MSVTFLAQEPCWSRARKVVLVCLRTALVMVSWQSEPFKFQFVVRRDPALGRPWGLSLVFEAKSWVSHVAPGGLVDIKNAQLANVDHGFLQDQTLKIGDIIRMVNGATNPDAVCAELGQQDQDTLHMWVDRRPCSTASTATGPLVKAGGLPHGALLAPCASSLPAPCAQPSLNRVNAGGNFVVVCNYDPQQEHEQGYLSLKCSQCVYIFPGTRYVGSSITCTVSTYMRRPQTTSKVGYQFQCSAVPVEAALPDNVIDSHVNIEVTLLVCLAPLVLYLRNNQQTKRDNFFTLY